MPSFELPYSPPPLRIGILGAAKIAPMAVIRPARYLPEVSIDAVAARDPVRARRFAHKHGIARVCPSYGALLEDPDIDAVYVPLPNSLHCEWSVRAMEAGKHVLCEKPLASNAEEAASMAETAQRTGRTLVEAFHWRCHPLAARMKEIVEGGELGEVQHFVAHLAVPFFVPGNIRFRRDLAGGACMDLGCYTVNMVRFLAGAEPEVVRAQAKLSSPEVDRWMQADLRFEDGRTARITCSLASACPLWLSLRVEGKRGEMRVLNPLVPHIYHRLRLITPRGTSSERLHGEVTYVAQLRAFAKTVAGKATMSSDGPDGVANMRVVDRIYAAAGLRPRGSRAT